jgi:hypothetical protein
VEADLLRFYGVDLLDYWRKPRTLSTRRLVVLVHEIPENQGSRVRAITGEWSTTEDLLDILRRRYEQAHYNDNQDPGPHPRHPLHNDEQVGPSAEVVAHVAALKAEREAQIAAGEIA